MLPLTQGFWGPPTSTVDWCESNYERTRYVAEFFNTTSSLSMVLAGLLGLYLYRTVFEKRFLVAFGLLVAVGLGSIAFHGTLRFGLQMLDELPMLYLVAWMTFILLEDGPTRRFRAWLGWGLLTYACVATYLCVLTRGQVEFYVFQIGFGALELFCMGRVYLLHRKSGNPRVRGLFRVGFTAYVLGIVVWFVDLKLCDIVSITLPHYGLANPQLHAVWHVLVSAGFFCLLVVVARELAKAPELGPGL